MERNYNGTTDIEQVADRMRHIVNDELAGTLTDMASFSNLHGNAVSITVIDENGSRITLNARRRIMTLGIRY